MEIHTFPSILNKATPGFELGVEDLQSSALPLGYVTELWECHGHIESFFCPVSITKILKLILRYDVITYHILRELFILHIFQNENNTIFKLTRLD